MTLDEKLNQLHPDLPLLNIQNIKDITRYNSKPYASGTNKRLGIPPILFSDGPKGIVMNGSTCFPVSMGRGATWDVKLEQRVGNAIGIEGRAQGANYFGGVCINLLRHPAWGRAQESYGEEPVLLGEMGAALTLGVQPHMMACAKHYACNSMENKRFQVDVNIDERTLREIYTPHFKRCVDAGVASIMSAYNKVNGKYCSHNPHLLKEIFKKDWGFKGFVLSDFIFAVRGADSVAAGLDIEMPYTWRMANGKIKKQMQKGSVTEQDVDDAVKCILRQKLRFAKTIAAPDPNLYSKDKVACQEHQQLALEVARKSCVLLQNKNQLLPLDQSTIKNIAVIGKLANTVNIGDMGSSRVYPPHTVTPLEGIRQVAGSDIAVSFDLGKSIEAATNIAQSADVAIIVAGFTYKDEGEFIVFHGGDRSRLSLQKHDESLINAVAKVNPKTIVVLEGGSAIITEEWRENVSGILMAWYPGMAGGTAIAELLFGIVNPSGKLPCVFPKSTEQLPFFDKNATKIEYGYYHGYRLMDKENKIPAFAFGFGLSYTTFGYRNLQIKQSQIKKSDKINVEVDVSNLGDRDGDEIVQLYIGYANPSVDRPVKDLKAFKRLKIAKKSTETVEFSLNPQELAYYDSVDHEWKIDPIEYVVFIGSSSRTEDLISKNFRIVDT
jgi:beta-glucosidase